MPARHARRRRCGFTLVELLVAISIIVILVGLTVTAIPRIRRAAAGAQTQAQMTALATAMQAYYNDFRAYPGPLPNNQVGITYYPTANYTNAPQSNYVYVLDPNAATVNTPVPLQLGAGTGTSEAFSTFAQIQQITGAENLVLGLLGGLELTYSGGSGSAIKAYAYNPANIFPDGTTPAPLGPMSLNPNAPKRLGAYLQVKTGDLSNTMLAGGMGTPGVFTDYAGRPANDSPIPEFLDKYSNPMPLLYLRANVGAAGVVSYGGHNEAATALPAPYQYDLAQVAGYTQSLIGTSPNNPNLSHHGLEDILPANTTTPVSDTVSGDFAQAGSNYTAGLGANAFAYLRDPNTPALQSDNATATTNATAHPRQKDGFILISAGPDGIYGTADDIIYPSN